MNQAKQDPAGRHYGALVPGEMGRTTGKKGAPTGWALVANVDSDEMRRLKLAAETLHGEVGLLRHRRGITFAISRIETGGKCYTFALPLVGREVFEMLRMLPVTGFRLAFSSGSEEVLRYAQPVAADIVHEFLASHMRRYSKASVLHAASDVALDLLNEAEVQARGNQQLACIVATPDLQAWAARQHRNG